MSKVTGRNPIKAERDKLVKECAGLWHDGPKVNRKNMTVKQQVVTLNKAKSSRKKEEPK